ncbi:MAG: glycerol kinase GlpK, partial [Clostridia bacterium]|nr:glycerol kinase GlpK [Clostridia bacterium]
MLNKYFLGIDQGTTGTTAILFDENFVAASRGYCETPCHYPAPGLVEHKAEEVLDSVKTAVSAALKFADAVAGDIICIGIDHEGESALMWDAETGRAIAPVITWQDQRTVATAKYLEQTQGEMIYKNTALHSDCYFSATKLQWLMQNVPEAATLRDQGRLMAGTLDSWILWNLTGGKSYATDASTASRTQLCNIRAGKWDEELLELYGLRGVRLPEIRDSAAPFGQSDPDAFLGIKAPIAALMCDQQSALLGQGCLQPGMLKTTYGTGCFMLMNTGESPVLSESGLLTTIAWQLNGKRTYALDGGVHIAGAATQWLRDGLGIIRAAQETGALAESVKDNGGVYFVPAFTGLSAPHRDNSATGMMIGLTGGVTKAHIVRATLESTAYQVCDLLAAIEKDSDKPITLMRCDGGATSNDFLMQFQADISGVPLEIPAQKDTTALGIAFLAAYGVGEKDLADLSSLHKHCRRFDPMMSEDQRQTLLAHWKQA